MHLRCRFIPWSILSVALSGVTSTHTQNIERRPGTPSPSPIAVSSVQGWLPRKRWSTIIRIYDWITSKVVFSFSSLEVYQIMFLGMELLTASSRWPVLGSRHTFTSRASNRHDLTAMTTYRPFLASPSPVTRMGCSGAEYKVSETCHPWGIKCSSSGYKKDMVYSHNAYRSQKG